MAARVLIVDDEPDILLIVRLALEQSGYTTALASDGATALRRLRDEHHDVVLLDVMMPVMDGWSALAQITTMHAPPRVLILTAKTAPRDVERAAELGASGFLTKPFEPADLVEAVRTVVAGGQVWPGSVVPAR